MKITRYFQSCILVEENGVRLLFDPSGEEAADSEKFGKLDAVLYTHEDDDHFDSELAEKFIARGIPVYANASVATKMKTQPNIVSDSDELEVKGIKVRPIETKHSLLWGGELGPQNTGYLVNDKLFVPGDSVAVTPGLSAEIVLAPITGTDISIKDAIVFAKSLNAKKVIPIHYDYIGTKPEIFARYATGFEIHILANGEPVEL